MYLADQDCCKRCKMTYYCSRECQVEDWTKHRKVCRKPGEFKIGDEVFLVSSAHDCPIPFGRMVCIWAAAGDNGEAWIVRGTSECKTFYLANAMDLRRCRPNLWNMIGNEESKEFVKFLQFFDIFVQNFTSVSSSVCWIFILL